MADSASLGFSQNAIFIGARTPAEARKYLSYLYLHSMFGGHVGLHESIRNEEPNRSLDSTRGTYDMLDVYTTAGINVEAGTVVNFVTDDNYNPLGETRVYPVTDTSRPLGYMVTKASPEVQGVCVVNGILEVPLIYEKGSSEDEFERKDFVEYDIDLGAFKFSDSGYSVFNIYQDVDGDWIAIILFGNSSVDISGSTESLEYNGSFKVTKDRGYPDDPAHIFYVTCNGGDVVVNGNHFTCPVLGYTEFTQEQESELEMLDDWQDNVALSSGEALWLEVELRGDTVGFNYFDSSDVPVDGATVFNFKLAEHNNDNENPGIRQIQYGDIHHNFTKVNAGANVHVTPEAGTGNITIDADMPEVMNDYDGPFKASIHFSEEQGKYDVIIKDASDRRAFISGVATDLAGCVVSGNGNVVNVPAGTVTCETANRIYLVGSNSGFEFVVAEDYAAVSEYPLAVLVASVGNVINEGELPYVRQELYGDVVAASIGGGSTTGDLILSVSGNTASITLEGSTSSVNFITSGSLFMENGSSENEVVLGSHDDSQYMGGFAVEMISGSTNTVKVFDRVNPTSQNAGNVVIGEYRFPVSVGNNITLNANETLYFEAWYVEDISNYSGFPYTAVLYSWGGSDAIVWTYTTNPSALLSRYWFKRLAFRDNNGILNQIHKADDLEVLGRWS